MTALPPPPADPRRCTFVRSDGSRCRGAFGLRDGRCVVHDPDRREQAQAARQAGGAATALVATQRSGKYRVATPEQLPTRRPPKSVDDVVRWSSWAAWAVTTGLIDPGTSRELNRSLGTLKEALSKRDLLRRIRDLEAKLKRYEQER